MPTAAELQSRVDHLEGLLAERDRKEAETRAAALAAQQATDDAKAAAERVAAAAAEREQIRRGSWTSHLLAQADPAAVFDPAALDSQIPKDEGQWPPGVNPADFVLTGGARIRPEEKVDVAQTTLGKMLAALTPKI